MGWSLQPDRLKRYRDIARLLIKYGRSDLVKHAKLQMAFDGEEIGPVRRCPPGGPWWSRGSGPGYEARLREIWM